MFHSYGVISPPSPEQKPGWYLLAADPELSRYYQCLSGIPWLSGINGTHMTFIAGEKDLRLVEPAEMAPYIGQTVEFFYTPLVYTNGRAFWFPALSPDLDRIRANLALPARILYHVTLGNTKHLARDE